MKHIITLIIVFFFVTYAIEAQEITTSSGSTITSQDGSVSYSVGQVFYSNFYDNNGYSVTQGVQQAFDISEVSEISKKETAPSPLLYPNPTSEYLILKVNDYASSELCYTLADENGRILISDKITGYQTLIKMDSYPNGIYFINISENKGSKKLFKIVKK